MGCQTSKAAAVKELQDLINQIDRDNEKLLKEIENLRTPEAANSNEEEKHTLQDINTMRGDIEGEVKSLQTLASEISESSKARTSVVNAQIQNILEVKEKLDKRTSKIKAMVHERENLRKKNRDLEGQIVDSEAKIRELAQTHFSTEEGRNQHYDLHQKVSELESRKENLLGEIEAAEANLQNLGEEAKNSGLNDKAIDPSNFEVLLNLSDLEVNLELKKVDQELEELTEQIRILKNRENDLRDFESFTTTSQVKINLPRNDNLKAQIKSSQDIVDMLESEKLKVKGELNKLKRDSLMDGGLSDKLSALTSIIEKKKLKDEENSKYFSENLVTDIENTLKKAKQLSFNKRDSGDLSDL